MVTKHYDVYLKDVGSSKHNESTTALYTKCIYTMNYCIYFLYLKLGTKEHQLVGPQRIQNCNN